MKNQYVIAIHRMRWLTNFYDFRFKWTATAGIGIHPTKACTVQQSQTWGRKDLGFGWATFRWASCFIVQQGSSFGSYPTFTRTMHQSTTPSFSQTIWPIWASRQFLSLSIVQTLLPLTFGYSLSSLRGCRYETIEEMKEVVTKVIDTLTQEDFHGAFQKLLEWYNKCIAAE